MPIDDKPAAKKKALENRRKDLRIVTFFMYRVFRQRQYEIAMVTRRSVSTQKVDRREYEYYES